MVKSINIRTLEAYEIHAESVEGNPKFILEQPAAPVKRNRNVLRAIFIHWLAA